MGSSAAHTPGRRPSGRRCSAGSLPTSQGGRGPSGLLFAPPLPRGSPLAARRPLPTLLSLEAEPLTPEAGPAGRRAEGLTSTLTGCRRSPVGVSGPDPALSSLCPGSAPGTQQAREAGAYVPRAASPRAAPATKPCRSTHLVLPTRLLLHVPADVRAPAHAVTPFLRAPATLPGPRARGAQRAGATTQKAPRSQGEGTRGRMRKAACPARTYAHLVQSPAVPLWPILFPRARGRGVVCQASFPTPASCGLASWAAFFPKATGLLALLGRRGVRQVGREHTDSPLHISAAPAPLTSVSSSSRKRLRGWGSNPQPRLGAARHLLVSTRR